jgi:hypothetical protein
MIKLSLDQPQPTQPRPTRPVETTPINPERTGKVDFFWYVAFSLAIGLLIGYVAGSRLDSFENQKQDEQIVEPDKSEKKSDASKVEAAGSVFVFVYEFQTKTADQELLVRDLRAWSAIKKCEFRQFDQDSKDAEPYKVAAEKAGLKSPFLTVVRDKKIVRVFDWPRDRQALEGLVK